MNTGYTHYYLWLLLSGYLKLPGTPTDQIPGETRRQSLYELQGKVKVDEVIINHVT